MGKSLREMCIRDSNTPKLSQTEKDDITMKENRKLLREVLKDIRHDMTDEEVLLSLIHI